MYPKPGPAGGILIRQAIATLRGAGVKLPLTSDILIGVSGGSDSVALAKLITQYGRRICAVEQVRLVHLNYGWRDQAALRDQKFVESLAGMLKVPLNIIVLPSPKDRRGPYLKGLSWEAVGRTLKQEAFQSLMKHFQTKKPWILLAHHGDDLAETILWRILTGATRTHGGGILVKNNRELRPLLRSRKSLMRTFLAEEGLSYCEDETNLDTNRLRGRLRKDIIPLLEELFPKAVNHLMDLGLSAQSDVRRVHQRAWPSISALFAISQQRIRRAHWEAIDRLSQELKQGRGGELVLPQGWKLESKPKILDSASEHWIFSRGHF